MAKRLNELSVGDYVAYTDDYIAIGFSAYQIWKKEVVTKDTDTQLTVRGKRFLRRNGIKVGESSWRRPTQIVPWSPEIEREIEETSKRIADFEQRQKLMKQLNAVKFDKLPIDKLEAIVNIINSE